jgi:DNA modification methylase
MNKQQQLQETIDTKDQQNDRLEQITRTGDNYLNRIIHGDALSTLKCFPGESIDLCVTSPPYWNQRGYGENPNIIGNEPTVSNYIDNLIQIFAEVKRVLKKSGSCFVVISDKFNSSDGSTSSNSKGYTKRRSTKREDGFVIIKNKDKSIPSCL